MIEIFKTYDIGTELVEIERIEKRSWINIVSPTDEEIESVQNSLNISPDFLKYSLDEEEKPHIDDEEDQTLIIVDVPCINTENEDIKYETIPLGILVLDEYILTICLRETEVINSFKKRKVKDFYTFMKTRFTLQILFLIAKEYLRYLRTIDKSTEQVEESMHKSMKNKELYKLFDIEKSLVFFTTSLKSNELVMEKLSRGKYIKMYEEDQDLLEDVIIENRQAIEMASIYSSILNGMMDAFSSVISNNLNIAMKFLTSVTIVMAIPTVISSFFGMNVTIPGSGSPHAFSYVFLLAFVICVATSMVLYKRGLF